MSHLDLLRSLLLLVLVVVGGSGNGLFTLGSGTLGVLSGSVGLSGLLVLLGSVAHDDQGNGDTDSNNQHNNHANDDNRGNLSVSKTLIFFLIALITFTFVSLLGLGLKSC